jgi:predicted RNA binding protein YcfA (HicA-like mRNA interferase family)
MSKLPSLTGKEVVSLLKKVGFIVERQRGRFLGSFKIANCDLETW